MLLQQGSKGNSRDLARACLLCALVRWLAAEQTVACFDRNIRCPPHVTPLFLEEAKGQGTCSTERDKYFCTVSCSADGVVAWQGGPCAVDLVTPCPPWKRTLVPEYAAALVKGIDVGAGATAIHGPDNKSGLSRAPPADESKGTQHLRGVDKASGEYLLSVADPKDKDLVLKTGGFDLRGLAVRWSAVAPSPHLAFDGPLVCPLPSPPYPESSLQIVAAACGAGCRWPGPVSAS